MSDAERHLAREFRLHPQEARALCALREVVGYCPDEEIEVLCAGGLHYNVRCHLICRLRRKLRGRGITIVRVRSPAGSGYRLEAA